MKLRDVPIILGIATATMAATLLAVAAWRGGLANSEAANEENKVTPTLKLQDCTFVLKADKSSYDVGESPAIEIIGTNPTDQAVNASVWVNIVASAPVSVMSRALPIPKSLWKQEFVFNLAPGETKTQKAQCQVNWTPGRQVWITLGGDHQSPIPALAFNVPGNGPDQPQVRNGGGSGFGKGGGAGQGPASVNVSAYNAVQQSVPPPQP